MSVQLNYASPLELEMIEYPGMVKNVDRMLGTLGTITKISQTFSGEKKRLELRYHHENPFNKAACSSQQSKDGLLLAVKVRRSKRDATQPAQYEVRILGHCKRVFTFESLCDFQFLPLHHAATSVSGRSAGQPVDLTRLVPQSIDDTEYFDVSNLPLMCQPQVFARTDAVHATILRGDGQGEGQHDVLGLLQKSNYDSRDVVGFNMLDAFPTRPDAQIVKRMKIKYVSDEQLECVKKLFDECPIWTRIALLHESGISNDKLKCITPSLAFYFSSGPWRTLYVRYGYDPRKDFKSRYYQTFDFRLRFRSGVAEFVSNRKTTMKKKKENSYELNELVQDINYPYLNENKLPRSRQCILRYCDVHIPKIQEMLEKIPSPLTGANCNEKTGWLPAGFDSQARQIVSNGIKELLRSHHRKEATAHAEFEFVDDAVVGTYDEDSEANDDSPSDQLEYAMEELQAIDSV